MYEWGEAGESVGECEGGCVAVHEARARTRTRVRVGVTVRVRR